MRRSSPTENHHEFEQIPSCRVFLPRESSCGISDIEPTSKTGELHVAIRWEISTQNGTQGYHSQTDEIGRVDSE